MQACKRVQPWSEMAKSTLGWALAALLLLISGSASGCGLDHQHHHFSQFSSQYSRHKEHLLRLQKVRRTPPAQRAPGAGGLAACPTLDRTCTLAPILSSPSHAMQDVTEGARSLLEGVDGGLFAPSLQAQLATLHSPSSSIIYGSYSQMAVPLRIHVEYQNMDSLMASAQATLRAVTNAVVQTLQQYLAVRGWFGEGSLGGLMEPLAGNPTLGSQLCSLLKDDNRHGYAK